jgi:hypothetical protein
MIKQKIAKKGRKRVQLTASEKIEKLSKYFGQAEVLSEIFA